MHKEQNEKLNTSIFCNFKNSAFTIVEIVVVVVVVAIIASVMMASYNGAIISARISALQNDLASNASKLSLYFMDNNIYPQSLDPSGCPLTPVASDKCLKFSAGNNYEYKPIGEKNYNLIATNENLKYRTRPGSEPVSADHLDCPTGYISVPGSITYNTEDFCVMKYEAKNNGLDEAVSRADSAPWTYISQLYASAKGAEACTGCHLITEAEWMTLAQNVLAVPENWSEGNVGDGFIYSGHNDNAPANALPASEDDDGYSDTGQASGNQKRTLKLTNGETIWDLSGNVWEFTSESITGNQPGILGESSFSSKEWSAITTKGSVTTDPTPLSTWISGAKDWTILNGIGRLYSNNTEPSTRSFIRGGYWYNGANAGVLYLAFSYSPTGEHSYVGFRVAR